MWPWSDQLGASLWKWIAVTSVLAVVLLAGTAHGEGGSDTVVFRNGKSVYGNVTLVDEESVWVDGRQFRRPTVALIIFSKPTHTRTCPSEEEEDVLVMVGGRRYTSHIWRVAKFSVYMNGITVRRDRVTCIRFGRRSKKPVDYGDLQTPPPPVDSPWP